LAEEWLLAAQAFQQATEVEAGNAEAWAWLGEAKQHLGQDAATDLERAVSLDGNSIIVRTLRGLYWKRQGNDRAALTEYQAAAAAAPGNPVWQVSLAETLANLGNLDGALESYQRAIQIAPEEPQYWRLLAAFCVEYGIRLREVGLPAAQKAVDLDPEDYMALDVLGSAQLISGEYTRAQETLLLAIDKESNYAPPHLHLAMVYLQTGDRNAAYRELSIALELDRMGNRRRLPVQDIFRDDDKITPMNKAFYPCPARDPGGVRAGVPASVAATIQSPCAAPRSAHGRGEAHTHSSRPRLTPVRR
jgi:tetratricopeptide (TPR) repeat protein